MVKLNEVTKNSLIIAGIFLMTLSVMQGCGKGKKLRVITSKLIEHVKQDSISNTKTAMFIAEFEIRQTIISLKEERSTLHNMNEIVLSNQRPSQRIEAINLEIEALELKLKTGATNDK